MGKYYCDYCDVFLVSESPSVRKAHNSGRNHLTNVRDYYSSLGHDKAQSYIDEITRMFETGGGNSTSNRGPGGPLLDHSQALQTMGWVVLVSSPPISEFVSL
ncbi:hypothetical protein Pst134EA_009891 [Puccinia striiformis f. sp. tritici]|uniref:hypothetical protein n=1 Tax=Puccinia striiformis f. sp. tritici TaxID=168172 RepID=UPI0020077404|nr:hypothetical protein Pst134EA_009891 [Puccinia striiformis f. sp. tritici]KAH9469370.1 hypothetical protein Pst134EA_009891 [Puccinia striiformis f. sp. tritici]